jgi:hypothetical protein
VGWLTVGTGTAHSFAIKRLALQDFALLTDDRTVWFCRDSDWASILAHSLLQRNDIKLPERASQG